MRSVTAMFQTGFISLTELFVDVHDCDDVMQRGHLSSGVYTILLRDKVTVLNVYCEISTDENWLVSVTVSVCIHRYTCILR